MLLYYITDRTQFPGDETQRRKRLLEKIAEAAAAGVNFIQLREKDLSTRELENLAREAVQVMAASSPSRTEIRDPRTALLINSHTDVALAVGAEGVHLRSDDISPSEVRRIWRQRGTGTPAGEMPEPLISVSCHSAAEVARAAQENADFAVLAPFFEKRGANNPSLGREGFRAACSFNIPVLALGGVTLENAQQCVKAGAAGIAAIRLFQENPIAEVVRTLRAAIA